MVWKIAFCATKWGTNMPDFEMSKWLKYAFVLIAVVLLGALPDFTLPSPQDPGWNSLFGLVHAVIVGAAFGSFFLIAAMWSSRPASKQNKFRRGFIGFLVFASGDFIVEISGRPSFLLLSRHPGIENDVSRLVRAGGGYLLPLVSLTAFVAFVFLRKRRTD